MSYSDFWKDLPVHQNCLVTAMTLLKTGTKLNNLADVLDELFGFNPMHVEIQYFIRRLDLVNQRKDLKVCWSEFTSEPERKA